MKLTDVARASLSELRGDFEIHILDRGQLPWSVHSPDAQAINAISLDDAPFTDDVDVHESAKHALSQRQKYAHWLDSEDQLVVANAMLLIIGRALNMLKRQIDSQGKAFEETGGFSERLTAKRVEARGQTGVDAPDCPQCGSEMRRRNSARGETTRSTNATRPSRVVFWGCSTYPACRGIREVEPKKG
jgi:restriction system protein